MKPTKSSNLDLKSTSVENALAKDIRMSSLCVFHDMRIPFNAPSKYYYVVR